MISTVILKNQPSAGLLIATIQSMIISYSPKQDSREIGNDVVAGNDLSPVF